MLAALLLTLTAPAWPLEELTLKNGVTLPGLVLDETAEAVRFRTIRRPAGRPTLTLTSLFPRAEIHSVRRLPAAARAILEDKLADLDASTVGESRRAESLTLSRVKLRLKPDDTPLDALHYQSERFTLMATTREEVARRAAVRLEQIFIAFEQVLPPRTITPTPTLIYLARDAESTAALAAHVLQGPAGPRPQIAFYDATSNSIVCGSELRELGADLAATRLHHLQQLADVARYEVQIGELYQNAPKAERDRHLALAATERRKVTAADRRNDAQFDAATARLFSRLYHEAFHAYVCSYVHRELSLAGVKAGEGTGPMPRWLNEGLAQIFETAILDGFELRVGHADSARLEKVQAGLRKAKDGVTLLPLSELLIGGFVDVHRPQGAAAYHTAWAVAFHLTFERRLLGTKKLDAYFVAVNTGVSPRTAFETLVGQDLLAYEKELKSYLTRLRPDGSLRK